MSSPRVQKSSLGCLSENTYSMERYANGVKLLPFVGLSNPGQRLENSHFNLSKGELEHLLINGEFSMYPKWLVNLIWPNWKSGHDAYKKFDDIRYKKIGIEYREFNHRNHESLAMEAIAQLFVSVGRNNHLTIDYEKTGVILCSCSIVTSEAKGSLKTDYLHQNKILNNIAEAVDLKPLFCVNEVCSGFLAALVQGQKFLANQDDIDNIVIVTSEKMSDVIDYNDPATSIIFGDLTAAVLLTKNDVEGLRLMGGADCYYSCYSDNDGNLSSTGEDDNNILFFDNGSKTEGRVSLRMNGRATYQQALMEIPKAIFQLAEYLDVQCLDQILCHQANQKIIVELSVAVKRDPRFLDTIVPIVMERGNLSSSSIPNLMYSMINNPFSVLSKYNDVYADVKNMDSIKWKRGMTICMASIGIGIYVRSLLLVYE